ncbi:hypothetical protein EXU85_20600 [Spirosoma sp. KCTC 42546]|uniref:hypothetical protein n=1 Tax=Spirosoma sp. KCTC 42546 TaxID=2520506 RepID=UPI001157AD1A|nr:hypothetical protein [Spirosoma sp. KCTC 42546]QDK80881.1 hypothetical protein EXU85_20600 [Spirosoma sp. KCTC 42546]
MDAVQAVMKSHNLDLEQAKKYVNDLSKRDETKQDERVDITLLKQYEKEGYIDKNSLAKLKQAILNEKSYAYISHADFVRMEDKRIYFGQTGQIKPDPIPSNYNPSPKEKPKSAGGPKPIAIIISGIAIAVVLFFIFFGNYENKTSKFIPREDSKYIDSIKNIVDQRKKSEVYNSYSLKEDIRSAVSSAGIVFIDISLEDKNCLWVYVINNGNNMDGLASILCSTAKRNDYKCVSIYDSKLNRLGRSFCN